MVGAKEPPEGRGYASKYDGCKLHKGIVKANRVRVNVPKVTLVLEESPKSAPGVK
jgi:hypothetical protein